MESLVTLGTVFEGIKGYKIEGYKDEFVSENRKKVSGQTKK